MNISSKKSYEKPNIEIIGIDNEISLVMMTSETDPGDGNPRGAAALPASTKDASSFQKNPFGKK